MFIRIFFILILFSIQCFGQSKFKIIEKQQYPFGEKRIADFLDEFDKSNANIINTFGAIKLNKGGNKFQVKDSYEKEIFDIRRKKVSSKYSNETGVNFSAHEVLVDNNQKTLTAVGNVQLTLNTIKLSSEKIIYFQSLNEIHALGNVLITDERGNLHKGENLIINSSSLDFQMKNIYARLSDGSQMKARNLSTENKNVANYEGTKFTPCDCDLSKDENPLWHFSARKTRINRTTNTVYHDGVTLHILDLPVLYTPTFAHPDWTVERRTGFLTPSISVGKETGLTLKQPYFFNKSKSSDYTITPIIFSKSGILTDFEYRKVKKRSNLKANIIGGKVDTFNENNEEVISAFILYNSLNADNWETKLILQDSSEDSFLRKYKLTDETILKSSLSTQKITNNSFSSIELYKIGSLSREIQNDNSPLVLPSINYERNFSTPYKNAFGKIEMSILELNDDEGHDYLRYSNKVTTRKNFPLKNGASFLETSIMSSFYDISKNKTNTTQTGNINAINSLVSLGWEDYIATKIFNNQTIIKPQAQTVFINGSDHVNFIPNRDSKDYRLDETNLFIPHRPLGKDLILPGGRFDYGVTSFFNNDNFVNFTGFIGQSLKIWGNNEIEFQSLKPNKVESSESDYITRFAFQNSRNFSTDWSARLDPESFEIYESITTVTQNLGRFDLSASHASLSDGYIKDVSGAENLNFKFNAKVSNDWSLSGLQNYNLHNGNVKLLKTEYGLSYSGSLQNCMVIELKYERETKTDPSIAPVTEVGLIFQFKYLGDVIETL